MIGTKLKRARIEANMTQSRLADGIITRNMLSRIENGAARPSIGTLRALSERLGLTAGYFLAEEAEDIESHKAALIGDIRKRLSKRDYAGVIERCAPFEGREDDEINFILAVAFYYQAVELYHDGMFTAAIKTFDEAEKHGKATVYPLPNEINGSKLYIKSIDAYKNGEIILPLPPRDYGGNIELYTKAMKAAVDGDKITANALSELVDDGIYQQLILIELNGTDSGAVEFFNAVLTENKTDIPLKLYILDKLTAYYIKKRNFNAEYECEAEKSRLTERIK